MAEEEEEAGEERVCVPLILPAPALQHQLVAITHGQARAALRPSRCVEADVMLRAVVLAAPRGVGQALVVEVHAQHHPALDKPQLDHLAIRE